MSLKRVMFFVMLGCLLIFSWRVEAEVKYGSFTGAAAPFGGRYEFGFYNAFENLAPNIKYVKVVVHATDGNKLKISLLDMNKSEPTGLILGETGTLEASNNFYLFYIIPENMDCPVAADFCFTVSKENNGNNTGDFIGPTTSRGLRFTNESWFYGTLNIKGAYQLFY